MKLRSAHLPHWQPHPLVSTCNEFFLSYKLLKHNKGLAPRLGKETGSLLVLSNESIKQGSMVCRQLKDLIELLYWHSF